MEPVLVLNNITKRYGHVLTILEDMSYTFHKGQFYGIIGASGAGKTTLLQVINQFLFYIVPCCVYIIH